MTFKDLIDFFDGMTSDWRGWKGSRVYESLEHDLRIEGTHDGRHVRLAITLWQSSQPDGWRTSAVITVDPGEQLSRVAEEVRSLLSM